jgi:hypothetical protein
LQHQKALQLQEVREDATSAAAVAAEFHSRAESLQKQVDRARAQIVLHAGRPSWWFSCASRRLWARGSSHTRATLS